MNIVLLILGTVLSVLFIIFLMKGSKYDQWLEALDGDDFPLKTIYVVGLMWQETKIGKLRGKIETNLKNNTTLYYSENYSTFYAQINWAQVLSFVHLILAITFLLAGGALGSTSLFYLAVGIFFAVFTGYYFLTFYTNKLQTRSTECDAEFPNSISKLALIVNSGVILNDAWKMVANGKEGVYYDLMKDSCIQMDNGVSSVEAIRLFGEKSGSDNVKKFTTALIQSIEKGGADLPQFLVNQSSELWATRRQVLLQKGEKAAGALLIPILLMFGGVMLIVIAAAMQSFSM